VIRSGTIGLAGGAATWHGRLGRGPEAHGRDARVTLAALLVLSLAGGARASDASRAGKLTLEPPTLHCIGVRWVVGGDANRSAAVRFEFRQGGQGKWRRGLDLFRVEREAMAEPKPKDEWLFAGSLFDLRPDTAYELRLTLTDADGGGAVKTLEARTWAEPRPPKPERVVHVRPGAGGGSGTEADPFRGVTAADQAARPGDLILLHQGVYPGPVSVTRSGTASAPIVWRSAGDGEAVFDGPAKGRCLGAGGIEHVFFEGLSFRDSARALALTNSRHVTVRGCRFSGIGSGIGTGGGKERRLFIADCVMKGPRTWPRLKTDSKLGEHRGIEVSGVGHVVAYNRISGFRDAIDTRPKMPVRGIDIHNNDVSECTDDGIELDYSQTNCRAVRNRITNCHMGISFQPSFGGPNYAVRNVMYNVAFETYKLHVSPPATVTSGGVLLHNTVVRHGVPLRVWAGGTPVHYYTARNNLYVFRDADRVVDLQCKIDLIDWDYDVFAGGPVKLFGKLVRTAYPTREAFIKASGQEAHSTFLAETKGLFVGGLQPPADPAKRYAPAVNDPRLAEGSGAIDKGVALPNINDGFRGRAPDAGALELGDPSPHYGPRTKEPTR